MVGNRRWRYVAASAIACMWTSGAQARDLVINLTAAQPLADALGTNVTDLENQMSDNIANGVSAFDSSTSLSKLADAASFSNRGLGVDYGTGFKKFMLGVGFNGAFGVSDGFSFSNPTGGGGGEEGGAEEIPIPAINASIMAGVNMGFAGMKDLTIFANYFRLNTNVTDTLSNAGLEVDNIPSLDTTVGSLGLHAQYRFLKPKKQPVAFLFKWGGVSLTTGISSSSMRLTASDGWTQESTLEGPAGESPVTFDSNGVLELTAKSATIPIEVSTSARLLSILGVYAGLGMDLQTGLGGAEVNLTGDVTGEDPVTGDPIDLGTATVLIRDEGRPSSLRPRFLGGVNFNLWLLKIFAQGNYMPNRAASLTFGVRASY